jgi:hypothetical protein
MSTIRVALALLGSLSLLLSFSLSLAAAPSPESSRSIAGRWRLAVDRQDTGIAERWFDRRLEDTVRLPGSLPAQGIGDAITMDTPWTGSIIDRSFFTAPEFERYRQPGQVKVPFWLQPEKYYAGAAWYQRDIDIPKSWQGQRIVLFLERPHWETRVWLKGQCIGTNLSLSTPHEYDLGPLPPGQHSLSIRVDNRLVIDVGRDSHSVSDHTQGNWNGIVGQVELRATPPVWIDDLQVYARAADGSATFRGTLGNLTGKPGQGNLRVRILSHDKQIASSDLPISWQANSGTFSAELKPTDIQPWDEFRPNLYTAEAMLSTPDQQPHRQTVQFGFRNFGVQGTQFTVNGQITFLRGTLECCIFPTTGNPPTDIDSWRKIIRAAKAHGLNNLRFHSWCPPEAAFQVADELGMYLHVECASWANASTTLGDGKPVDVWLYAEADRILRYYGNHPSFVMLLYGNEPGGKLHEQYLSKWITHYRHADNRRLYSGGAGWPQLPENEFHVSPDPRVQAWGGGLKSRINAQPPETRTDYREYISKRSVPVVSHEIGQWCVYPNFDEMRKYTGYLKPRNFEIFRDTLAAHGMEHQARQFLFASGKLQALCYKEDIESALRTPGMAGFQLLDLHDFPGQGTALVGVLDPFWEQKGYITPAEYHRFSGPTVPLARMSKRVFTQNEQPVIDIDVAHFGPAPLENVQVQFRFLADDGKSVGSGSAAVPSVAIGNGQLLTQIKPNLKDFAAPAGYKLIVSLTSAAAASKRICENDWDIWVYPSATAASEPAPKDITVVDQLAPETFAALNSGGKVLWLLPPDAVAPDKKLGKIALGFSSIFWNTAWTGRQAPHTLGILCDPRHPLFKSFPTDSHSNWQWWYLISRAGPMILTDLPSKLQPTVQVIDDWFTARKLGLAFEAKVGNGKLMVCSIDLRGDLADNPVARQFRHSLFSYISSDQFRPKTTVTPEQLQRLTTK